MKCPLDGYPMDVDTDWLGRTVIRCVACDRRRAGKCQDCGKPVEGKDWRCAVHKAAKKLLDTRVHHDRHREARQAAQRKAWREKPERRAKHSATSKAWREAHTLDIKRQKFGRKNAGYLSREKYLAYQRAYNEKRKEAKRQAMRERYHRLHPRREPTCLACGQPFAYTKGPVSKWCPEHRGIAGSVLRRAA